MADAIRKGNTASRLWRVQITCTQAVVSYQFGNELKSSIPLKMRMCRIRLSNCCGVPDQGSMSIKGKVVCTLKTNLDIASYRKTLTGGADDGVPAGDEADIESPCP